MDFTVLTMCRGCGVTKECILLLTDYGISPTCIPCAGVEHITVDDVHAVGPTISEDGFYPPTKQPNIWETWDGVDIWGNPVSQPNR